MLTAQVEAADISNALLRLASDESRCVIRHRARPLGSDAATGCGAPAHLVPLLRGAES
jgi:hypothetical protein